MCRISILFISLTLVAADVSFGEQDNQQSSVVLDEDLWVTFYDLPSRRFRSIRTAILTRDFDAARRDLAVSTNYLSVEAERAAAVLKEPLRRTVNELRRIEVGVEDTPLSDVDTQFGRAHWLLAQHYLYFARLSRDARHDRNTSLYLWATAHHIERAILWSDAAVTRDVQTTLAGLRDLAGKLQDPATAADAYRERPVVRAEKLLQKVGTQIDRRVLVSLSPPD